MLRTLKLFGALICLLSITCSCANTAPTETSTPTTEITEETPMTEAPKELTEISAGLKSGNDFITNPVSGITSIGDPFILVDNGKYYMYATSAGIGFKCWVSDHLTSWSYVGLAYEKAATTFGVKNYWAPEVYKYNGTYYMVFSAIDENKVYHIGIASSSTPEGPFKDCLGGKPLYSTGYSIIDASLFFDDDGRIYMYYSRDCSENVINGYHVSQSYGIEVASDLMSVIGEPVLLTTPDVAWELQTGKYIWNEGPCVLKHNGTYYLMYSANGYATNQYSVGYATSSSPLGTYTKSKTNPIIKGDGVKSSGTGHNNYFYSPDGTEIYTVYHTHTDPKNPSGNRTPCVDKLVFGEDGELYCFGPNIGRVPLPSGEDGTYKLFDGVNVSTDAKGADVSVLTDQRLSTDKNTGVVTLSAEESVTVTLDEPRELYLVWVYNGTDTKTIPSRITLEINGEYVIKDVRAQSASRSSNVISLSNLPEGTKVHTIKISVTPQDGKESADICEILLQYKIEE